MEFIPNNPMLKFNPDTLIYLRKLYNFEKKEEIDEAVDKICEWIAKQKHFRKKDFSRSYLERTIIFNKGSIERAKTQTEKLCTYKTLLPAFFEKYNVKTDFAHVREYYVQIFLPKLTQDHYRVYMGTYASDHISEKLLLDIYNFGALLCEYIKVHDYCNGFILIYDYRKIKSLADAFTKINIADLRKMMTIGIEGYCVRIKGIHFITTSKAAETIMNVVKQTLSAKVGERMFVHKSHDTLYDHIPRELLPLEYGGDEESYLNIYDKWIEELSSESNIEILQGMIEANTDESLRQSDKFNEQYSGMAGTFRTLSID